MWVRLPSLPPTFAEAHSGGQVRHILRKRINQLYYCVFHYVYYLNNSNNISYIGCTNNLRNRLERHNNGYVPATKELRPIKLIWYSCFEDKYLAFNFEKYLKTCSGRVLINKRLINGLTKLKAK